jgi:K+-transporting ATPase A subunit
MLVGRFLMIIPALAVAGSMVGKKTVPAGPGTFPSSSLLPTPQIFGEGLARLDRRLRAPLSD